MSRALANVEWWEYRSDRPYDERNGSKIRHPNGTRIVCFDRPLIGALLRAVLDLRGVPRHPTDEERRAS